MLKNRKIILGVIAVIFIVLIVTVTMKRTETKTPDRDGYKTINDVPGVGFSVKKDLFETATAVMEISKNIEFLSYQTYSYKNGTDTYLLFNMNNYIVIAKKGTSFYFDENGVEESLQKNSLNGIWFSTVGKDAVKESSGEKYVIYVDAQVVINNDLYNDFIGNLVTLKKDGEEWTIFAGTTEKNKENAETMQYITETFSFSDTAEMNTSEYTVDENGILTAIEDTKPEENHIPEIVETIPEESKVEETEPEETRPEVTTETPAEEPEELKEDIPVVDVPVETEPGEVVPVETVPVETVPVKEDIKEESEKENIEEISVQETFTANNNQSTHNYSKDEVYTSSIYSMLKIGYTGYISLQNSKGYQNAYVRVTDLYSAEETEQLIKEYCQSGDSYYKEFTAPDGMHFEAVSYDVNYLGEEEGYVNIKLCGLDGEDLKYRGICYSHMTYDIQNKVEKDDEWCTGYICFYAVPNGCKEYALKCGEGTEDNGVYAAYYRIGGE